MKEIEEKEEITKNDNKLINIFIALILKKYTQESFYLLEKFIELQYIKPKIVYKKSLNFLHYLKVKGIKNINFYLPFSGYYKQHYKKLSKNDWELHKQLLKKGVNPNEISKIIRNDEIEKLQDLSSQDDFNFNQTIEPSPYERCSFINKENVSLIDYAAYFSAVKCFKYLLMNGSNVNNTAKYAIAGGNLEIIHLCEQNHLSFKQTIDITIQYHINEVFHYLYENKLYEDMELELIQKKCIMYYNYEILLFLLEEGMKFSISFLNEFAKIGNMFILKPFIEEKLFPNDVLVYSSMSGNIELVKCILDQKVIDINSKNIKFF